MEIPPAKTRYNSDKSYLLFIKNEMAFSHNTMEDSAPTWPPASPPSKIKRLQPLFKAFSIMDTDGV